MTLRCLVVEDQLMIQQLLVAMLQREPRLEVLAGAASAAEGIAACAAHRPDLLILDIALPDADGLSVARALHVLNPDARVIMLSSFASTVEWPHELRHQLSAILDKARAFEDLIAAIHRLLPDPGPARAAASIDRSLLTGREQEILALLGQGLTSQAIAQTLQISVRTVQSHRHNIASKLNLSGAALVHQATLLLHGHGAGP